MQLRFVGQPFSDHLNLIDFIEYARENNFEELKIAVAWAKRSGLGRVWDALEEFRDHGGKTTLILGVSEGGATREGLELALRVADEGFVFHDPRRTFHPKVYFASSAGDRSLMVGSSNLTAGGLSWNYEASLWVDWSAGEGIDVTSSVSAWFDTLIGSPDSCSPLTAELIEQLAASDDITLGSESRARRVQKKQDNSPEDNDGTVVATISGLFKPVLAGLRKLPGLSSKVASTPAASSASQLAVAGAGASTTVQDPARAGVAPFATQDVVKRWSKKLDNTAAQQVKSPQSNATGNLRLSREDAAIDHTLFFRDVFFDGLPWAPTDGKATEQEVLVSFRTWIDGLDAGIQELRISHDPRRISNQGNVPTVLHWGSLSRLLRGTNYVGMHVSLERTTSGDYNLVISEAARGPHLV